MPESFHDDEEKMRDFISLDRAEFLKTYSYITDEEYGATVKQVVIEAEQKGHHPEVHGSQNEARH